MKVLKFERKMEPGWRTLGNAALCLRVPDFLAPGEREHIYWLTDLQTKPESRRKGLANALMRQVCSEADEHGKSLLLTPRPDNDEPTADQLKAWYFKHRFAVIQNADGVVPCLMLRGPQ